MEFPADAPHRQDLMAVLQEEEAALAPVPVGSEWRRWHHEVDTLRNFLSSPTKPLHATIVVGSKDPAVNWESLEERHLGILERECWQHVERILQGAEFLMDAAKRRRVRPIPRSGIHAPPVVIFGITCVQDPSQTMFPRTWDRHNAAHHHGLLLLWRKQSGRG